MTVKTYQLNVHAGGSIICEKVQVPKKVGQKSWENIVNK